MLNIVEDICDIEKMPFNTTSTHAEFLADCRQQVEMTDMKKNSTKIHPANVRIAVPPQSPATRAALQVGDLLEDRVVRREVRVPRKP